jgi:hypothetical protein
VDGALKAGHDRLVIRFHSTSHICWINSQAWIRLEWATVIAAGGRLLWEFRDEGNVGCPWPRLTKEYVGCPWPRLTKEYM